MPFVVAIILCLIGDSDAFFKTYSGGIVQNLESLIQLLIMTIILLLSPMITTKIMSESGVSHVADSLGQMAGMATLIGGASFASRFVGAKSKAVGGMIHNSTSRPMMKKFKGAISSKAQSISAQKGIGPSIQSLMATAPSEKIKHGLGDLKDNIKNTSFREKMVLATDSVINKRENGLAKVARSKDVQSLNSKPLSNGLKQDLSSGLPDSQRSKLPIANYKKEASEYLGRRSEFMNQPRLQNQFMSSRRSFAKSPSKGINEKISSKSLNPNRERFTNRFSGKKFQNPIRSLKDSNSGLIRGGLRDFRNV
jgi:hypothetical protein